MDQPTMKPVPPSIFRTHWKVLTVVLVIWIVYAYFTLTQSTAQTIARYGISEFQVRLIGLSVALPLLAIWMTSLYGAVAFYDYAHFIRKSRDGQAFSKIAWALLIILISSIASSLIGLVWQRYRLDYPSALPTYTIARNYLTLGLSLLSYLLFYKGSRSLLDVAGIDVKYDQIVKDVMAPIIIFSVVYTSLVFHNPFRTTSDNPLITPTYFLPDALILFTIIIPFAIQWMFGILAAMNFWTFSRSTQGILYREALSPLIKGLMLVVTLSMSLQVLSQFSTFLGTTGLGVILIIVYLLLAVILIGNFYIASGAKRLKKIETV